jgi:hypothetical protein
MMNDPHEHYNACYDNDVYHKVQIAVLQDIHGDYSSVSEDKLLASEPANTILNVVIDTALEISVVEYPRSAMRSLIVLVLQHNLSDETIQAIADHLRLFERLGDNHTNDFIVTIAAIRHANDAEPALSEAIRSASEIHSKQGHGAYHLLTAAHALIQATTILLKEGQGGYLDEKLALSVKHMQLPQLWLKDIRRQ